MNKSTSTFNLFDTSVEFVGMSENFAWIRFSNGMSLDIRREDLEAIVEKYNEQKATEEYVKTVLGK
jgi:hypothetical protein